MNTHPTNEQDDADPVLVVDIGGTRVRVGTTSNSLTPLFTEPTPPDAQCTLNLVAALSVAAAEVIRSAGETKRRLVCGSGGLITSTGVCTKALYTPFAGVDIREELVRRLGGDIHVINDASLQAHGYIERAPNSVLISIGTGVGGAIISDGKVLAGAHGFAGEIGHALTTHSEIRCQCGRVGCLDTVASGFAFTQALGSDWFHRTDNSLKMHLERLAAAVADSAMACVALLDVATIILVGWPARFAFVRNALMQRLNSTSLKVDFMPDGWTLAVLGARKINATLWRNT